MSKMDAVKKAIQDRIAPAEIIGDVGKFPLEEKDGQLHLFKVEYRCLVAVSPRGPLLLMGFTANK